jgi:transcription initiation factor TFIIIB Brf1 subunit/transcription initiation factor TFIIB
METYNLVIDVSPTRGLACDLCDSINIIETREGYVCGDCGVVLDMQKLEYHRPYNDDIVQYAPLGLTQIGTKRERMRLPNSVQWEQRQKLHRIRDNEKAILQNARKEISRIFSALHLPAIYQAIVLKQVKIVRTKFRPRTKYRSVEKLVPVVIYHTFKLENIAINEEDLIIASEMTKKEFKDFFLQIQRYSTEYKSRNRQEYIIQKILRVTESFGLGMEFYYFSRKILDRLWELIKNTTDNVITGVVTSIAALCSYQDKVSVNALCSDIGIRMSTVQFQVRERIFNQFRVAGFVSLVRSSDLLRTIMEKLGLLEPEEDPDDEPADLVEIIVGNASQVFNCNNGVDYYFFAVRDDQDNPVIMTVKIYNALFSKKPNFDQQAQETRLFDYERLIYYRAKGPPISVA